MSQLFSQLKIRNLSLDNRIVVAPMCQYSARDGRVNEWHRFHYGELSVSGAGMLIVEAAAVSAVGRITPGCVGLYDADNVAAMAEMLAAIRGLNPGSGQALVIQLAHAGRKASSNAPWNGGSQIPIADAAGWQALAPSSIPHLPQEEPPQEMSQADIRQVVEEFLSAARHAQVLGFDGVELHAAHGYLLHQFLSPVANHRQDEYGGSLENRMRLPLEILEKMRALLPANMTLGVRLSATDWDTDSSWNLEESVVFAKRCEALGVDYIHVSSAGVSCHQKITLEPGYQVPMAAKIREEVAIPVIAVGLITEPEHAESIVANGEADLVALARGFLYDPRWVWHAAAKLQAKVVGPKQYWRSAPREHGEIFVGAKIGMR